MMIAVITRPGGYPVHFKIKNDEELREVTNMNYERELKAHLRAMKIDRISCHDILDDFLSGDHQFNHYSPARWSEQETKALDTLGNMLFMGKAKEKWEFIKDQLNEEFGNDRTGASCRTRFCRKPNTPRKTLSPAMKAVLPKLTEEWQSAETLQGARICLDGLVTRGKAEYKHRILFGNWKDHFYRLPQGV